MPSVAARNDAISRTVVPFYDVVGGSSTTTVAILDNIDSTPIEFGNTSYRSTLHNPLATYFESFSVDDYDIFRPTGNVGSFVRQSLLQQRRGGPVDGEKSLQVLLFMSLFTPVNITIWEEKDRNADIKLNRQWIVRSDSGSQQGRPDFHLLVNGISVVLFELKTARCLNDRELGTFISILQMGAVTIMDYGHIVWDDDDIRVAPLSQGTRTKYSHLIFQLLNQFNAHPQARYLVVSNGGLYSLLTKVGSTVMVGPALKGEGVVEDGNIICNAYSLLLALSTLPERMYRTPLDAPRRNPRQHDSTPSPSGSRDYSLRPRPAQGGSSGAASTRAQASTLGSSLGPGPTRHPASDLASGPGPGPISRTSSYLADAAAPSQDIPVEVYAERRTRSRPPHLDLSQHSRKLDTSKKSDYMDRDDQLLVITDEDNSLDSVTSSSDPESPYMSRFEIGPIGAILSMDTIEHTGLHNATHSLPLIAAQSATFHGPVRPEARWMHESEVPRLVPPTMRGSHLGQHAGQTPTTVQTQTIRLDGFLTYGSIWDVYRAHYESLQNENIASSESVIVKVCCPSALPSQPQYGTRSNGFTDLDARKAIQTEFRVYTELARLGTLPKLLALYGTSIGSKEDSCWAMVLEDVGGGLSSEDVTGLNWDDKMSIVRMYEKFHEAGVVHNDPEPRHWTLHPSGPKCIDFGRARFREHATFYARAHDDPASIWAKWKTCEITEVRQILGLPY